jgi:hypothetical protein
MKHRGSMHSPSDTPKKDIWQSQFLVRIEGSDSLDEAIKLIEIRDVHHGVDIDFAVLFQLSSMCGSEFLQSTLITSASVLINYV